MKLCSACKRRCDTWSKELESDGYNGCLVVLKLFQDHDSDTILNDLVKNIKAQTIGFGWIKSGGMAYNNQPIVRDVESCKFYIGREFDLNIS